MKKEITPFDKTEAFNENIEPMIKELVKACKFYEIPLYVTACTKSEKEETTFRNYHVSTVINNQKLKDDQISKHILVSNGFEPYIPTSWMEIMTDQLLDDEE